MAIDASSLERVSIAPATLLGPLSLRRHPCSTSCTVRSCDEEQPWPIEWAFMHHALVQMGLPIMVRGILLHAGFIVR